MLFGVLLEELASSPFDCEKMQPGIGLPDLYGTHHVGVLYSCAVLRFADEASDCGTIMPQFFTENLEGDGAMARMLSPVHLGGTAFSNLTLDSVPGYL